jgi:hypothetical protein
MENGLPAIDFEPPYSLDFLAHLHGGCYPPDVTARLLEGIGRDLDASKLMDSLTLVQLALRLVGHDDRDE